jgi:hypothetical protein
MRQGEQNMKTGPDAVGTVEIGSGSAILDNKTRRLDTVENGSGSAKYENGTRRRQYRRKGVRERKT